MKILKTRFFKTRIKIYFLTRNPARTWNSVRKPARTRNSGPEKLENTEIKKRWRCQGVIKF